MSKSQLHKNRLFRIYSKPLVIDISSKSYPHRLFMIYVSHWSLVQVTNTNDIVRIIAAQKLIIYLKPLVTCINDKLSKFSHTIRIIHDLFKTIGHWHKMSKSHPHKLLVYFIGHLVTNTNDLHCQNHNNLKMNDLFRILITCINDKLSKITAALLGLFMIYSKPLVTITI